MMMDHWWNAGETKNTWSKTCSSDTLLTTNLAWTCLGLNPGVHG